MNERHAIINKIKALLATAYGRFFVLLIALGTSQARADDINNIFKTPGEKLCGVLNGLAKSPIVGIVAIAMVFGAIVLFATKSRGALPLGVTAVAGFFFVRQSVAIANSFGLNGCDAKP